MRMIGAGTGAEMLLQGVVVAMWLSPCIKLELFSPCV